MNRSDMNRKPMKTNILILGHADHGKTTVACIVAKELGVTYLDSSFACAEKVMLPAFANIGVNYNSVEECYLDRGNHRDFWHKCIAEYNTPDKARLAKEILITHNIYCGMRCKHELQACVEQDLFHLYIWVDSFGRGLPPEPETSMSIEYNPAYMVKLHNYKGMDELEKDIVRILHWGLIDPLIYLP